MSKMCEPATAKTKSSENYQQTPKAHVEHKHVMKTPSKEVVLAKTRFSKDHVVEVTVTGSKRTLPVTSFSPNQKEKKTSTLKDNQTPKSWTNVLGQQNLLYITQQTSKHNEGVKRNVNSKKQQESAVRHSMRSEQKRLTSPCSCSSILVQDFAVQCDEINNSNKFAEFNSVYMLYLIKQLKDSVNKKDKRACEIFTEMEQILQGQETEIESNAIPLKESNKKKVIPYELFISEREKLQSEILKRDEQLKEVDKKYLELERLTQQLDEEKREKNNTISVLRQEIENNERIIIDLKENLHKQTDLAHKNYIDNKYLIMEKDKLSMLFSYKDAQIINYQNTIKELQNQITRQLKTINEICKEGSTSPQISLIHTGYACSSPNSSFSDGSKSWHDSLDISSVDSVHEEHLILKDAPVKDFELVSLLDGESSQSVLPDQNEVMNDKGAMQNNTVSCQSVNTKNAIIKKSLHHSKKDHNKENDKRNISRLKGKQNDNTKNLFLNASKVVENVTSTTSMISDIKKQSDMQTRKPITVPSPLREYPHPDWSDSSLPSISTVSNLDMVPSNDV
ncbi:spindle pole body component 110 isoform X2 [Solenopsis invicta]|uniref:spindle pole body component 110 isoform X2 n=1 Tax=Solenopsis invicta TaxID=13686 RepID=UPI00193D7B8F|nr:spindle pole body component 110 isoform X2 [Solenopsis invicta]